MATEGFSAIGTIATFNGNTIGEIESFDAGEISVNFEKILTTDSLDYYADVIAKALDSGDGTFRLIFQPSATGNYAKLKIDTEARTKATLLITYPNGASFSGNALVTRLGFPVFDAADGVHRFNVTFTRAKKHDFVGT